MKKTLFSIGLAALVMGMPGITRATFITDHTPVPVTEAQVEQIKSEVCSMQEFPCEGTLLNQLVGNVILRVEKGGKMQWVNGGDGAPLLNGYLPDGFYVTGKSKKKYYVVMDGTRRRIKRGNAYKRTLTMAQKGHARAISESDLQSMVMTCELHPDDNGQITNDGRARYAECIEVIEMGDELQTELEGSIAMRVEAEGQLSYVPSVAEGLPIELGKRVNGGSFLRFAKQHAEHVPAKTMKTLLSGKLY